MPATKSFLVQSLIFLALLLIGCKSPNNNQAKIKKEPSFAYKLTSLEKNGYATEDDITVKRFEYLLSKLESKYGLSQKIIGDMTYKAKTMGEEQGLNYSMIEILEGALMINNLDYPNLIANYVTFRSSGITHEESMELIIKADNSGQ